MASTEIPFETQKPEVGVIKYKGMKIQFVELPSVYKGYAEKNREYMSIVRNSDIIVSFINDESEKDVIIKELEYSNIYTFDRPKVRVIKEPKGGIKFIGDYRPENENLYKKILMSYGISNATVIIDEEVDLERFALAIDPSNEFKKIIFTKERNIEICEEIREKLGKIRVFTKQPGKEPNLEEAIILDRGATIRDVVEEIHEGLLRSFKFARVWGKSVKFDGQKVGLDHILEDGDIVEIRA